MAMIDHFLPEFMCEMGTARKVLERCPEEKYDWRPHERSMAMGDLATHIVQMLGFIPLVMVADSFDYAPGGQPPKRTPAKTRKELLERFDTAVASAQEALAGATDESLGKTWTLLMNGQTIFSLPRAGVLRSFMLNHIIHHRGQLSVYLRLNDVAVPSIYGPSADERA